MGFGKYMRASKQELRFNLFLIAIIALPSQVTASIFTFTKVADTTTPVPGGTGTFGTPYSGAFSAPSIDGSNLAFEGIQGTSTYFGQWSQEGIYKSVGGALSVVADRNTYIPGAFGPNKFYDFEGFSLSGANVVIDARDRSNDPGASGIYTDLAGSLDIVANDQTQVPGGALQFAPASLSRPRMDGSVITFHGSGFGQPEEEGFYSTLGGALGIVADLDTPAPGSGGNFAGFGGLISLDNSLVAFHAVDSNGGAIFTNQGGSLRRVADQNTVVPGKSSTFNTFSGPELDNSKVLFHGSPGTYQYGLYLDDGGVLSVIVDETTLIPDHPLSLTFASFETAAIDNGNIAFKGRSTGQSGFHGIFVIFDGVLEKVIDVDSTLDGKAVESLYMSAEGLSGNRIAFRVVFEDGSEGIYFAEADRTVIPDGDLAPLGDPDGVINVADYLIGQRIVTGIISAGPLQLAHGDLYPAGAPDGVIDLSDLILLLQLVQTTP